MCTLQLVPAYWLRTSKEWMKIVRLDESGLGLEAIAAHNSRLIEFAEPGIAQHELKTSGFCCQAG